MWVTRFRRKILVKSVTDYLKLKLHKVCKYYPDWHLTEIGMENDQLHLHMGIPPQYSVDFVVGTLKKIPVGGSRRDTSIWQRCIGIERVRHKLSFN